MRTWLVLILMAATTAAASGREIYVNNLAGSDEFKGQRESSARGSGPLRTINRALCLARPGDKIVVAKTPEPYREQLSIAGPRLRGNALRPLTITSDGAVLDGTVEAAVGAWRHVEGNVFAMRPRRLAYQQLFRAGKPLDRVRLVSHADAARGLEPLEWSLVGGALYFHAEQSRLPASYGLRHAGLQTGVTLYNTQSVVIEGLVIQGFQQDGVNAHELVKDCVLRNVECRANGRSGLSVGGVSRVRAQACNVYDNGRVQVRTAGLGQLDLSGCDIEKDSDAPAFDSRGGELTIDGERAN